MQTAIILLFALLAGSASGVSIVVDAMTRLVASKLKAKPHRNGIEVRMLERKPAPEAALGVAAQVNSGSICNA